MVIVSEQKENNWVLNSDTPDCLLGANKEARIGWIEHLSQTM